MNKNTLYIAGNGFDLFHNFKTQYSDFGNYIKNKNSELSYYLENYFHYVNLWTDFENVLSTLDIAEIFSDNEDLVPNEESDRTGDIHNLGDKAELIIETLTNGLRNALKDWVLQLEFNVTISLLNIDKNAIFFTFNYTDILERLYEINHNQITYIHNKAIRSTILGDNSDIIIGHVIKDKKIKMPKQSKRGIKTAIAYEEAFDALKPYYIQSFKDTEQVISENRNFFDNLSNIEEAIILGHSLSDIDMPYFQEISKNATNVKKMENNLLREQ
jgi:hypothetical protein